MIFQSFIVVARVEEELRKIEVRELTRISMGSMTMKDWDKKRISQYFDTTELLKLVNDSTQTDKVEPQKKQISLSKTKMKRKKKVEHAHRILPIRHHHSSKR